jgi:ferredoxin
MQVDHEHCDVCGTCVSVCPTDAIRVREFSVSIDPKICVKCGNCLRVCPMHAIRESE